jgi:hypothetical protein
LKDIAVSRIEEQKQWLLNLIEKEHREIDSSFSEISSEIGTIKENNSMESSEESLINLNQ